MDLLYSLSTSSTVFIKLIMGASIIGGNLLRMKSFFTFVMVVSFKSDIDFKLNMESGRLIKESN